MSESQALSELTALVARLKAKTFPKDTCQLVMDTLGSAIGIDTLNNISLHQELFQIFAASTSEKFTELCSELAHSIANKPTSIVVHCYELDLYGVYSPIMFATFIAQIIALTGKPAEVTSDNNQLRFHGYQGDNLALTIIPHETVNKYAEALPGTAPLKLDGCGRMCPSKSINVSHSKDYSWVLR
jgi:hypothetical protein